MKKSTLLKKLIVQLSEPFDLDDLGILEEQTSKNIKILNPKNKDLTRIVVFYKNNSVEKINFFSENPILSLNDLQSELGEAVSGYNFRDNITKLYFSKKIGKIKEITTKKTNKIEIIGNNIIQTTPKGEKLKFSLEEDYFNSICFLFN